MATGNMLLGLSRKKLGDIVFYRSDGQQRARVRVRTIKNPRSAKQSVQRMVLSTTSKTLAALRNLYNHSFESVAVGTPSLRYAQKILMDGYRARAAVVLNGGKEYLKANFAIKGAPMAGCYEGMPLTKGRLSFKEISAGVYEDGVAIFIKGASTAFNATITTQQQYIAALAELGIEPGDQLTAVVYAQNTSIPVAEFGSEVNFSDMYRYARVTFKATLPDKFSGNLIVEGAFNPALIETAEGTFPVVDSTTSGTSVSVIFDFLPNLPAGYEFVAGTLVRSKKTDGGVTYYNNASFVTIADAWDWNNAVNVYESYMNNEEAINVGDTLYLKNAEAAPLA